MDFIAWQAQHEVYDRKKHFFVESELCIFCSLGEPENWQHLFLDALLVRVVKACLVSHGICHWTFLTCCKLLEVRPMVTNHFSSK